MRSALIGSLLAALLLSGSGSASAQSPAAIELAGGSIGLVTLDSAHPIAETERLLVQAIEAAGLKVAARIDHEANAQSVGLQLPPTILLLFGNPRAGTLLIEQNRSIGIDLPLKVLIWEVEGRVRLSYTDPATLARRHGISETTSVLSQIAHALHRFATAATAP